MAHRPSSIDRLPKEVKETIGRLRESGRTVDEIHAKLLELDVDVSRSAVGRHVQKLAVVGERMRRSKDMATALASRFGEQPDDQVARLNIELLHGAVFELLTATPDEDNEDEGSIVLDAKSAKALSEAMRNLAAAQKTDADRMIKIETEALKKAAARVDATGKKLGWSAETARNVRAEILGLPQPPAGAPASA